MQDFIDKKIIVGITGGIAAYKTAYLVRNLCKLGAEVRVVMTNSALKFITPLTMQALSGQDVRTELFDPEAELGMGHIELARWADYLVIAPASANCLAKLAHGIADDLLSTLYLATSAKIIMCPAMNQAMWAHPATRRNCSLLNEDNVMIVGPDVGEQACGDYGSGRLVEVDRIINALRLESVQNKLLDKKVLITAGPTHEALDPVRYLSNHSSGKMGYALAQAALIAGAEVTLISGPTQLEPPLGVRLIKVNSAKEMQEQVMDHLAVGMIFIGCAAVADYSPNQVSEKKIKKETNTVQHINLTLNPDILAEVASSKKAHYIVGFAAETDDLLVNARKKLHNKQVDMIIANLVSHEKGFNSANNEVTLITKHEETAFELTNKTRLAGHIIEFLAKMLAKEI